MLLWPDEPDAAGDELLWLGVDDDGAPPFIELPLP